MSIKVLRLKNKKILVHHYDSLDSTNEELKKYRLKGELQSYTTILATTQTSGRGQRNNTWYDEAGKSLLSSTYIKFSPEVSPLKVLLIFSLSAHYACSTELDEIYIKWPNDIVSKEGYKIAGILIENTMNVAGVSSTVGGIGINVSEQDFPLNIPMARSLEKLSNKNQKIAIDQLLELYLSALLHYLDYPSDSLLNEYCSKLLGYQSYRFYRILSGDEKLELKIMGLGEDGLLRTLDRAGNEHIYSNKELEWVFD